jgi:hypothetical protein
MRKATVAVIGIGISLIASGAAAADYAAFADDVEEAAVILTSIRSCKQMGFDVDDRPSVPEEVTDITVRRGVMLGIDRAMAEALILDAVNRELADMELLSSPPVEADTVQKVVANTRELFAFWNARCERLTHENLGARYVRQTGKEVEVQERLFADVAGRIEAAARGE